MRSLPVPPMRRSTPSPPSTESSPEPASKIAEAGAAERVVAALAVDLVRRSAPVAGSACSVPISVLAAATAATAPTVAAAMASVRTLRFIDSHEQARGGRVAVTVVVAGLAEARVPRLRERRHELGRGDREPAGGVERLGDGGRLAEPLEVLDRREDEEPPRVWAARASTGRSQRASTHSLPSTDGSASGGAPAAKNQVSKRTLTCSGAIQRANGTSSASPEA